jgi:hypothetical protein
LPSPLVADDGDLPLDRPLPDHAGADAAAPEITLSVADLLPAEDGSVIFDTDLDVGLTDHPAVVSRGTAASESVAGGQDVSGFQYLAFETGMTVYVPPNTALSLVES